MSKKQYVVSHGFQSKEVFTNEMFDEMVQQVDELVITDDDGFFMELRFEKSDLSCDVPFDSDNVVYLKSKMIQYVLQFDEVSSYSFTPPHCLVLFVT